MGNAWGNYRSRTVVRGDTRRETALERERRYLKLKVPNSLDYNIAIVDGVEQRLAIIDSDNYDQKTICSMPGEDIRCGARVDWAGQHWLVITKDAKTELRTRCIMLQCNYLLRFVGYDGSIQERWCYIEDGTKYLTGEWTDGFFVMTRGDSRIAMTITKDEYTSKFNRESRFLIDDYDSEDVLAYRLTKPMKVGGTYGELDNTNGVFKFVLSECNREDDDNIELHIADYYNSYPKEKNKDAPEGKKVWI